MARRYRSSLPAGVAPGHARRGVDEAAVIQTSRDARNDLMQLFEADAESDGDRER
ncbi:hypothetical protein [Stenotrophomonas maltophilia]|uniref:hypothetical protein n=1 Tax=Stenotrophomonas maltophilia TaxID=40324 RepID=UPI0034DAE9F2